MEKIFFSLVQPDIVWENESRNIEKYDRLLDAIPHTTEIVILPEMFATGFTMNVENLERPVGQKTFLWLKDKAKKMNKIIIGSILTEERNKYFNRMYWMRPDGSFDYYDKRHLFHMGNEHKVMTAGDKRTLVTYKNMRFLLQICYDLRFPVWSKNTYNKQIDRYEYDAIIYIANWPEIRKNAYLNLIKARAIENQAFVIWVNRVGSDGNNIEHAGHTQVVDYLGNIITSATENKEEILNFSFHKNDLIQYRNQFKVGLDWDNFRIL